MIPRGADGTLRDRAAAALSRRRAWERLNEQERRRERSDKARVLIEKLLGVTVPETRPEPLAIAVEGLLFDASQYDDRWRLNLLQPCIMCGQMYSTALNDLADLGALLEDGPSLCERCDG